MSEKFYHIIKEKHVFTVYQPIIDLKKGDILGYEALSRGPEGSKYYSPLQLIDEATHLGCLWELEMLFRQKALEGAKTMPSEKMLFLNVDPNIIKSSDYKTGMTKATLDDMGLEHIKIAFELTERTMITDYPAFQCLMENYRNQGYIIAMDDVGAGYSGLKTINEIRPHFIKIDMDLIRNIDKDTFKQALIKAFVDTATQTNIRVIAEGIETKEELKMLILLGVHYGQGYYLQKPEEGFRPLERDLLHRIENYNQMAKNIMDYSQEYHYISNLLSCDVPDSYESMTKCISVKNHMKNNGIASVCVCENGRPVGLVMKSKMDSFMSAQYGYALYANRPISNIMNKLPLVVDRFTPISVVAKHAMDRSDEEIYEDIIVTEAGKFIGLVPMKKIIEYTLVYEKNNAKEHNPLTGLPGNPIINRVLSDLVEFKSSAFVGYIDINEFKIFNDVNGFDSGDKMIKLLADTLRLVVKEKLTFTSFVGHIGGDDFLIVVEGEPNDYEVVCRQIIDYFDKEKLRFFSKNQLEKKTIVSEDRFGVVRNFPLTSLSVSGCYGNLAQLKTVKGLTEKLAELKKKAKLVGKSHYIIEKIS